MNKRELGNIGENIAVDYLRAQGFKILERNYRCRMGEIDIIAKKGGHLYFVEVKTRQNKAFGGPFESVTLNKQRQVIKIARYFLLRFKRELDCHLSVIGIIFDQQGNPSIDFLEDAFQT